MQLINPVPHQVGCHTERCWPLSQWKRFSRIRLEFPMPQLILTLLPHTSEQGCAPSLCFPSRSLQTAKRTSLSYFISRLNKYNLFCCTTLPALHRFGGLPRLRVNWCFRVTETYLMAILGQRCTAISEGLTRALQSCAATPPPAMRAAR